MENMEPLQLQRYREPSLTSEGNNEFYRFHVDTAESHRPNRRIATWVFYLSDVEEGGETVFPFVNVGTPARIISKDRFGTDHDAAIAYASGLWNDICGENKAGVLKVKPRKGSAVLFYSLTTDLQLDTLSVHGSCPVLKGTKLISQQWIRESAAIPHNSPHVMAYYPLHVLEDNRRIVEGRAVSDLDLILAEESVSRDAGQMRHSNDLLACSHVSEMLSSRVRLSHGLSFSFQLHVKECGKGRENAAVSFRMGDELELRVSISKSCGLAVYGLDKSPRVRLTSRITEGWSHIVVIVQPLTSNTTPDFSNWSNTVTLFVNGHEIGSSEEQSTKIPDGGAVICARKGTGMLIRELYIIDRAANSNFRKLLRSVSSFEKDIGKNMENIAVN